MRISDWSSDVCSSDLLPTPAGFAAASQFVRPDDVAESIAAGPDLDELAESVRPYLEAGFTDIAIVQVGDEHQDRFVSEVAERSEERRVGKECISPCRSRWAPYH